MTKNSQRAVECAAFRLNQVPVVSLITPDVPVCVWVRPPPSLSCASGLLLGWTEASPGNDRWNKGDINSKAARMSSSSCNLLYLPSHLSWWAWPGGAGWEHRGPSCPSSWSPHDWRGAGRRPDEHSAMSHNTQNTILSSSTPPGLRASLTFAASHLIFNMYDSFLGQRARLNHTDSLSGKIGKDFLTTKTAKDVSMKSGWTFNTCAHCKKAHYSISAV